MMKQNRRSSLKGLTMASLSLVACSVLSVTAFAQDRGDPVVVNPVVGTSDGFTSIEQFSVQEHRLSPTTMKFHVFGKKACSTFKGVTDKSSCELASKKFFEDRATAICKKKKFPIKGMDPQYNVAGVVDKTFGSALVVSTGIHITCDVPPAETIDVIETVETYVHDERQ